MAEARPARMAANPLAHGRSYVRGYRVAGRGEVHQRIRAAVRESGGELVYSTPDSIAPMFIGVRRAAGEALGAICYAFRCNAAPIPGRSPDEHRIQIRYGGEKTWATQTHQLSRDPVGLDVTVVVGVHLDYGLLVGLDPRVYDPLPMGISVEFKEADLRHAVQTGWHAWRRPNRRVAEVGMGRSEVLVAFRPQRFLDYVILEQAASRREVAYDRLQLASAIA